MDAGWKNRCRTLLHDAGEVVGETLWPSRCALCGKLGMSLCQRCQEALPYLDLWRACPRCGAPFGMHQCCECNSYSLRTLGRSRLPYAGCVSAVAFGKESARIVRMRKDHGARDLAHPMGFCIACAVPPAWLTGAIVTYVPSTVRARRRRGFCHAAELAEATAGFLRLQVRSLLSVGKASDMRTLGRAARAENASGVFRAQADAMGRSVIVVDDVYTTGSTAMSVSDALSQAGADRVYVATFARV